MSTHPCHWDQEGNSEVFLNACLNPEMPPPPKPQAFFLGAEGCHLRKAGITSKFLWREKSLMKSSECQNFSTGFPPKRFPAVERGWPAECRVSGSIRPPHPPCWSVRSAWNSPSAGSLLRAFSRRHPRGSIYSTRVTGAIARRWPRDLIKRFPPSPEWEPWLPPHLHSDSPVFCGDGRPDPGPN